MSQPDDERRRLEEELARLKSTPDPSAAVMPPGDKRRLEHPGIQRIQQRALERMRLEIDEIIDVFTPEVRVDVQPSVIPAPQVTVEASVVPAPQVRVDVPDQSAAIAQLAGALAQIVDLLTAWFAHESSREPENKEVTFKRNGNGQITGATVREA